MSFLRRLLGGNGDTDPPVGDAAGSAATDGGPPTSTDLDDAEREHIREVLREESARLDDLRQRQLRYAPYAWTPPAQGGERRADDEDTGNAEGG